jgi:low temperature requirement protein LtrA
MMFFGFFFFLFDVLHYGLPKIGLAVSIGLLFVVSFVLMTRKYGSGLNDKAFISTGAILFVVGGLWFTCDITDKLNYFTNWIPGLLILGVGMGLLISSIDRAITNRAHASQHAITIQIIQATSQIGTVIGVSAATLILGENFSSIEQFQTIYAICASLMLCAALFLLI